LKKSIFFKTDLEEDGTRTRELGSGTPDALLRIEGGIRRRLVVHLGGVPIDGRSALGAEVAITSVEIECADAVFAAGTLEMYSAFSAIGSVVCHGLIVVLSPESKNTPR
jgi:hypothetical protein